LFVLLLLDAPPRCHRINDDLAAKVPEYRFEGVGGKVPKFTWHEAQATAGTLRRAAVQPSAEVIVPAARALTLLL
jgi:hypothetical protein